MRSRSGVRSTALRALQTLGSVQGLRYSLVRYWLASGWLMIRSATGSHVELFAGPERDVAQVADARQAVAVTEMARALGSRS